MSVIIFPDENLSAYKNFEVRGLDIQGIPAIKRFSHLKAAKKFADLLTESEIWCITSKQFVYGNSKMMVERNLHIQPHTGGLYLKKCTAKTLRKS